MTAVLDIDVILAADPSGWLAYALDDGERPDPAILARARRLHEKGLVLLCQRRERDGLAYLMRRRGEGVPETTAQPRLVAVAKEDRQELRDTCAVCGTPLASRSTSGVCRRHMHDAEHCRCGACRNRRLPEPQSFRRRRHTDEQVRAMREMWRAGATYPDISRAFGLRESAVAAIVTGYCYRDVPGAVSDEERRARYGERGRKAA